MQHGSWSDEHAADTTHVRPQGRLAQQTWGGHMVADVVRNDMAEWGKYAPAIARWEQVIDRPAPEPTDGEGRLNPALVTWMMGYPEGWVDGIPRTGQLKCLGNAIVPHQAAAAWGYLLGLDVNTESATHTHLLPTPRTSDTNGPGSHGTGGMDLRTTCQLLRHGSVAGRPSPSGAPNAGTTRNGVGS